MDIKTAFLNAPVDEVIYVKQPQGFIAKGKENHVLRLLRSLYGLKQAPRNFNIHLTATLEALAYNSVLRILASSFTTRRRDLFVWYLFM